MAPNYNQACLSVLQNASTKMDGAPVLYATEYGRPDNRLRGTGTGAIAVYAFDNALKAASKALSSGVPTDGWVVFTEEGMGVFGRGFLGKIGSHKGTIPNDLIGAVGVQHDKKPGKATLQIVFADQSSVELFTKTKATYEALSPWVQGRANAATSPLDDPGSNAPDSLEGELFDSDALFASNPSLRH